MIVLLATTLFFAPSAAFDHVERDAAGMVVVEQVVFNDRILEAVAVDAGAAVGPVVVNDVAGDHRAGHDAAAALADVAVEVNAVLGVAEDHVVLIVG